MAAAFYNRAAGGRGTAESAGTEPAGRVHPQVVAAMLEVGIDLSEARPKLLTQAMADSADRVISTGCNVQEACPTLRIPVEDWEILDPAAQPLARVREIRDEIARRVDGLLREGAR
jgi:arsenate reductase